MYWDRDQIVVILLQTTFSNAFSWMKTFVFQPIFNWNMFVRFLIDNMSATVQIMAWRRTLSKPMMAKFIDAYMHHLASMNKPNQNKPCSRQLRRKCINCLSRGWYLQWQFPTSNKYVHDDVIKWKKVSVLLAICAGNSPGTLTQRPVTWSFDVFFDLRPNKRLSKQWWGWWLETPSSPLWRHCNVSTNYAINRNTVYIRQ